MSRAAEQVGVSGRSSCGKKKKKKKIVRRIRETRERREFWGEKSFRGRRRTRERELERQRSMVLVIIEIDGSDFGWEINRRDVVK
jgi:ABC-type glutathione transport system ATPase component